MVRIPLGNEKSARLEVRTVAPFGTPYHARSLAFSVGFAVVAGLSFAHLVFLPHVGTPRDDVEW